MMRYPREARETQRILPRLFVAALREGHRGRIAARDAIADCIETDIRPSLYGLLPLILLLAKISPMIGLLGTVWDMINAFQEIAGATKVEPSALASDIGTALSRTRRNATPPASTFSSRTDGSTTQPAIWGMEIPISGTWNITGPEGPSLHAASATRPHRAGTLMSDRS